MKTKSYLTAHQVQEMFVENFNTSYLKAEDILAKYKDILQQINITNINN